MAHPLDGSRARVQRAADHLEDLEHVLNRFARDGGFRIASEPGDKPNEFVMRAYSLLQPPVPPPPTASVIVGDVLNNLRSALDYIVWQLAKKPTITNQFPLFDSPARWEAKRGEYLASVPEDLWPRFEQYQPYPERENNRGLLVLAKLNNADKHRLLLTVAAGFAGRRTKFTVSGIDNISITGRDWIPFEDGAELHRIVVEEHEGSRPTIDASIPHGYLFRDPDSSFGATISDLRMIRLGVSNVVESFAGLFD